MAILLCTKCVPNGLRYQMVTKWLLVIVVLVCCKDFFVRIFFLYKLWERKMRTGKGHSIGAPGSLVAAIKESRRSTPADLFLGGRQPGSIILALHRVSRARRMSTLFNGCHRTARSIIRFAPYQSSFPFPTRISKTPQIQR